MTARELMTEALARRGEGVLFIGAHPDDESFALGGHLAQLPNISIVIITDGAPRDGRDSSRLGFATPEDYAAARKRELVDACAVAGIPADHVTNFGVPDQEPIFSVPSLVARVRDVVEVKHPWLVLTHAYEGGHPDHDAVALVVHAALRSIGRAGGQVPSLVEMPYYRVGSDGQPTQGFEAGSGPPVHHVELSDDQLDGKLRMLRAHTSQQQFLGTTENFRNRTESFRIAPDHDFTTPPNGGRFLYETWQLGVTSERWMTEARKALAALGLS